MSVYPALCGYLGAVLPAPCRYTRVLILYPAAWTATEILRGWLFGGFPWLLIGYSQVDSPLAVFVPLLGVYGVGFITATAAASAVVLLRGTVVGRRVAALVLASIILASLTLGEISWTRTAGDAAPVALIQGAIPQAVKWNRAYRQPTIDLYAELSEPHWGKALIVWPETAIPAFAEEVSASIAALGARAKDSGTTLLIGMPTGDPSGDGGYFNSVVQFGDVSGRYDKRHLVPFGEYLPFDRWLRPITTFLRIPMSNFSPGPAVQPPLSVNGYSIGVSICYEDAYAGEIARALPQANVLVNVSNDAWFGESIAPHQHLQIARLRALETGRYLLRATNTGISAIIDDRGNIVASSKQFIAEVVSGEVIPRAGSTPAVKYGVTPVVALCLIMVAALSLVASWRRTRTLSKPGFWRTNGDRHRPD